MVGFENNNIIESINKSNELLLSLNTLIEKSERELLKYFSDNVNQKDMHGEIELPLVLKADYNSDYYKLKLAKQQYQFEIDTIDKVIANPHMYLMHKVNGIYHNKLTKEQKEKLLNKEIELLIRKRKNYADNLRLIDEDPKNYIRLQECRNKDFSVIKNKMVRKELEDMKKQLDNYYIKRREISNIIKDLESKNNIVDNTKSM